MAGGRSEALSGHVSTQMKRTGTDALVLVDGDGQEQGGVVPAVRKGRSDFYGSMASLKPSSKRALFWNERLLLAIL